VGTMIIKSITRGPWGEKPKTRTTWYQPFEEVELIQPAVNFVLSHDVTGLCTAGDTDVLPRMLAACDHFSPLDENAQEALIASADQFEPLFS
jgi:hypothetical protein